jgi:hypothetical protein
MRERLEATRIVVLVPNPFGAVRMRLNTLDMVKRGASGGRGSR